MLFSVTARAQFNTACSVYVEAFCKILYNVFDKKTSKEGRIIMNTKTLAILYPIIAIISVAVMIVWGMLGNAWNISWIAVFIGGCLMAILSIVMAGMNKKNK